MGEGLITLEDLLAKLFAEEWVKTAVIAGGAALLGVVGGAILLWMAVRSRLKRLQAPVSEAKAPPAAAEPGAAALNPENPALKSFQWTLEAKGIPATEVDSRMRNFAEQLAEMTTRLDDLDAGDEALAPQVIRARECLAEGDFPRTVALLNEIADTDATTGREIRENALNRLRAAASAWVTAGDLQNACMSLGEAADCYSKALQVLPAGSDSIASEILNKHGTTSYQAGDLPAATKSFERALVLLERMLGRSHPDVATGLNNLALLHYSQGNFEAAEPLYSRALQIDEQTLGTEHPGVATDLNNLALLYKKQGKFDEAAPLLKRSLMIKEKVFNPGHPSLVTGLKNYASLLRALGQVAEAEAMELRAAALPPRRTEVAE
jgi:tetratricopeptide (TPR) repeat protein